MSAHRIASLAALALCVVYLAAGAPWIWRPGIQSDEALFSVALYPPFSFPADGIRVFGRDMGVMVMSYVGAVKAHLWTPVFALFGVSAASIRIPALILGAISIWWFYRLLLRTLGLRAALCGCALLALDPLYILLNRLDWGPVAIQHLLLIGGLLGIVTWWQTHRAVWLALGFFAFGIALWDKALFAWSLAGMGVATIAVFPHELRRAFSWRTVAIAVVAFGAGAFLLVRYNVRHQWITFRSNTVWTTEGFGQKVQLIQDTLNGSALFGGPMRDEWEQPARAPETPLERVVLGLNKVTKGPRHTPQGWLFATALLLLPFVWKTAARRAVLFAIVFMIVTWAQMAAVHLGGTGVHHTILLWPMPQLVISASFAYASQRIRYGVIPLVAVVAMACLSGAAVLSTYYANLIRNGSTVTWTDAIYPVGEAAASMHMKRLCTADWGFFDNLVLLHRNKIPMCVADDPVSEDGRKYSRLQIADPTTFFIAHTAGNEIQEGSSGRIERFAASIGYRKVTVGQYMDSNGRKVIEIFMFRPSTGS